MPAARRTGSPVHAPDPGPRIVPLLEGSSLSSGHGSFAFCSVVLVEATARDGQRRRIVVDTGHVGTRRRLRTALAEAGIGPDDVDVVALTHAHWDHSQKASAARLADLADVVYPGHDRPFRVADGQTEYWAPFSFTLTGVAADDSGLRAEPAEPLAGPEDLTPLG